MLKIGLTGGIGSGKSTATQYFAALGVPIIDADVINRELILKKNSDKNDLFPKIVQHFGSQILASDGEIDRKRLRRIIFSDAIERKWLENLLHPLIYAKIAQSLKNLQTRYCIVVAPLLLETHGTALIDRVLLIDVTTNNQMQRTMLRDDLDQTELQRAKITQMTREARLSMADEVIDNNGSLAELQEQVLKLHRFYSNLALT